MPKVLVADADVRSRDIYLDFFSGQGFRVDVASNGLECLSQLRHDRPDVVVLDNDILWGGALGVLSIMRDCKTLTQVPVVVVTNPTNQPGVMAPFASPLVQILAKPHSLAELLASVWSVLRTDPTHSFEAPSAQCPGNNVRAPTGIGTMDRLDSSARSSGEGILFPRSSSGEPCLLLVDDDEAVRNVLKKILERCGLKVRLSSNGKDAIEFYRRHRFGIGAVLLDVQMTGLDGPHTFDGLRRINPDVRVCFMSGNLGDYTAEELLAQGAVRVFCKPFQPKPVAALLRNLMSLGRTTASAPYSAVEESGHEKDSRTRDVRYSYISQSQ